MLKLPLKTEKRDLYLPPPNFANKQMNVLDLLLKVEAINKEHNLGRSSSSIQKSRQI